MDNSTQPQSEIKPATSQSWFKAVRSQDSIELILANPNAFVLAYIIAYRARWNEGFNADGLTPGEAMIGDHAQCGMSEQNYRTAKTQLAKWGFATFKPTNKGTIGKLIDARLFNPLNLPSNDQTNGQLTDDQRTTNGQLTTNKKLKKERREQGKETDEGFEKFWSAYPRKVKKAEALKKWKGLKVSPGLQQIILKAVGDQLRSDQWRKESGKFIPYPTTWLNGEQWNDELAITTTPRPGGNF